MSDVYRTGGTGWVYGRGMVLGGYWGRVIPVHPARCKAEAIPAKRAPEAPARGLEWVGIAAARPVTLGPPLPAVGPTPLSQAHLPENTRLLANKGEIP